MINKFKKSITSNSILLLLVTIIIASCNNNLPQYVEQEQIDKYKVDSFFLPNDIVDNSFFSKIYEVEPGVIFYLDEDKNLFYYYDLKSNSCIDSISPLESNFDGFVIKSKDSFYYVLDDNRLVTCFNKKQKIYDLSPIINSIDSNLTTQTRIELQITNDTIVTSVRSFTGSNDTIPSRQDVLSYYDIFYKIDHDSIKYIGKYNPNRENIIGQDFYTHLGRNRLVVNSSKILYAYEYRDSLLVYDFNQNALKYSPINTSNFKKNEPFDNKRFGDADYTKRYLYAQTRFTFLFYDKHQSLVYHFLKHKGEYVTKEGEKNAYYDMPFSLLVYDKDLKLQKELLLGVKKYWPLKTFITNDGLYIAGHKSTQKTEGKTMFYRFHIAADSIVQ
ncbi:MAG: hypothetical protein QM530_02105 [Phycisphaerales bacterium]|nr:hypothetical protein [Phycisphaerales bacterium]